MKIVATIQFATYAERSVTCSETWRTMSIWQRTFDFPIPIRFPLLFASTGITWSIYIHDVSWHLSTTFDYVFHWATYANVVQLHWKDDIIDMATVKAWVQLVSSEKRPAAMSRPGEVGCLYKGAGPIRLQLRALRVSGTVFWALDAFRAAINFSRQKEGFADLCWFLGFLWFFLQLY